MAYLWEDLRERAFCNLTFNSLDTPEDHLEATSRSMKNDQDHIISIVAWPWLINT